MRYHILFMSLFFIAHLAGQPVQTYQSIILAAGKSSRFDGPISKVLTPINGKPMVFYPIQALVDLNIPTIIVIGHQANTVRNTIIEQFGQDNIHFAVQEKQNGTGHAVKVSRPYWQADNILIMYGDKPLTSSNMLQTLIEAHEQQNATISIIVAHRTEPGGYGRIVTKNNVTRCIEAKDFDDDPQDYPYVNGGYYLIKREFLEQHIDTLWMHPNKAEYYINDMIEIASKHGHPINLVSVPYQVVHGVNTQQEFDLAKQFFLR